ncbi:MAG TPA: efflux RND transporter periplasmic adaptor subunit [Steroidobacteraceae bacterium]|nr:efflux RND transporter periplasmic adaptor subunit [Steroidobacteraceae bacterium]
MPDDNSILQRRALPMGQQLRAIIIVTGIVVVVALLWSVLGRKAAHSAEASGSAPTAGQVRLSAEQLSTLGIATVKTEPFHDAVVADGQIAVNADTTTQVFSPYSGRVVRVLAGIGDRVHSGAPLVSLDASENLDAQSALVTALSQARLARLNETRRHAAYDSHGGSLQDWQQAQADLTAAEAALSAARGRLRVLGSSDAQIQALEAAGKVSATATISSPITGLVTDRQIGPGQVVQAGDTTPIFTVADLSTVWLLCAVRDMDAAVIAPGQLIHIHVQSLPERDYRATVQAVGAEVDVATHRVLIRATVPNPDGRLKPAMFTTSEIVTSADSQAPAIPPAAIVREGDQAHVWVVRADGVLQERAIQTGRSNGAATEVRQGLAAGERIVISGSLFIDTAAQPD